MAALDPYGTRTPRRVREHLAALPRSQFPRELYWAGREPIFFRGRLDGTAKVLGVGQDPGVCEHVVGRTFVGTAGERVQYLLDRLGLSESYVLVNAHQYEIRASCANRALKRVSDSAISAWRNRLFDLITDERHLQAVIAFGKHAEKAVSLWAARPPSASVVNLKHPTSRNLDALAENWRTEYPKLRAAVWPDPGCQSSRPRFRQTFAAGHPAPIPDGDLAA